VAKCRLFGGHPTLELFEEAVDAGAASLPLFVEILARRDFREGSPADCAHLPVHALRVLAEIGDPGALPAILGVLADPVDPGLYGEEAALALARFGEAAVKPLARVARDGRRDLWVRAAAMQGLAHAALRDRRLRPRVLPILKSLLDDRSERDRTFVAQVVEACCRLAAESLWPSIVGAYQAGLVDEDVVAAEAVELELSLKRHRPDAEAKRLARRDVREDYVSWDDAVEGLPEDDVAGLLGELHALAEGRVEPPEVEEG
jgi:hypothetical protein